MARLESAFKGGPEELLGTGGGVFSPLALAQYSALVQMRWRIFVNGLRSKMGAFEFGAPMRDPELKVLAPGRGPELKELERPVFELNERLGADEK